MCNMGDSYVRHDALICATWRTHMCDMTHSYVRHDALRCATWRARICDMSQAHVTFICATWLIPTNRLIHMCDMTHSYKSTHSYVRLHDIFIRATWGIHRSNMTHSYVRHDSFISIDSFLCATWRHIHTCNMGVHRRGGGLGSSTIFKKFNEPYAPS